VLTFWCRLLLKLCLGKHCKCLKKIDNAKCCLFYWLFQGLITKKIQDRFSECLIVTFEWWLCFPVQLFFYDRLRVFHIFDANEATEVIPKHFFSKGQNNCFFPTLVGRSARCGKHLFRSAVHEIHWVVCNLR